MSSVPVHDFASRPQFANTHVRVVEPDAPLSTAPVVASVPTAIERTNLSAQYKVGPGSERSDALARTGPQNIHEVNALIAKRQAESLDRPIPHLSLAAKSGSALAVLDGPSTPAISPTVAEARAKLRDAQNVRAGAREALAAKEAALAKAQAVEREAIEAESRSRLVEVNGGDEFARRVVEWAERGGEEPDLAPDAASLDARHERDRARVKAAHARQAVEAIGEVVEAKRAALTEAETRVQAAARNVIECIAEEIATEGRKAHEIHRRAELAARALKQMQAGLAAIPVYRPKPNTVALADAFNPHNRKEPADALMSASTTWQAFQRALEGDADATLG